MQLYLRKCALLLSFALLLLTASFAKAGAQSIPVSRALHAVTKTFGTKFVYEKSILNGKTTNYDIQHLKDKQVEDVLKGILYPEGLVFLYVKENYYTIVLRARVRESLVDTSPVKNAPTNNRRMINAVDNIFGEKDRASNNAAISTLPSPYIVSGKVIDSLWNPLAGVSVRVKNTTIGTVTDEKGNYSLKVEEDAVLEFSSIGYMLKEAAVKGRTNITVMLQENKTGLGEVVIIGYGTQQKANLTGSISTINAKEIAKDHSNINITNILAGRLPGLFAIKTGGAPGSSSDLYIRGLSTTNNSSPLIVVDGIPGRSLEALNPNDVQSISVLKDAASIAVYGARSANGVILITTKDGKIGKPEITFSMSMINQRPIQIYKTLNSYQYASLYNEALKNENSYNPDLGQGWSDEELQKFKDGSDPDHYPNTNWVDEVLAPSIWQSSYNLSASGGNENTKYYLSAGYANNNGLVPVEGYKRYNLRGNIEARIANNLKLNMDLAGILTKSHGEAVFGSEYIISQVYNTPPTRVNRFSNGKYAFVREQRGNGYLQSIGKSGYWKTHNNIINSNLSLQYNIPWIKGLSVKGTMAYDKNMSFGKRFAVPYDMYSIDAAGDYSKVSAYPTAPFLREYYDQRYALTYEGSVHYEGYFSGHHISGLLLYTQTQTHADNFNTQRENFVSSALAELSLGDPTQATNAGGGSQSARQGIVGRFTYDYKDKYLAEFNFRYDGSDIFPPGNRFGFFPSISAGWVLSQEPFFKNAVPAIDFLKIRGSWGQLGNDRVNPYQFLSTYSFGNGYSFGGPSPTYYQSLAENVLPNPDFSWERAVMTNIGIEAHIWNGLLGIEADYFYKRTKDILIPPSQQVPSVIGVGLPDQNNGIVDNSGLEISLTHFNHIGKLTYYIEPNISFNHNKVIYFPESTSIPKWQQVAGKSVPFTPDYGIVPIGGYIYQYLVLGYHSLGLYQNEDEIEKGPTPPYPNVAPGDIRYADRDNDGKITSADQVVMAAHFFPAVQYGIKWGAAFKGLELNVLMQGAANVNANAFNYIYQYNTVLLDHWTPDNRDASYPRLWINNQNNTENSDYWVRNTSYMRVKNMELAYSLPQQWLKRIGVKNLRVSVSGNNLITFTQFKLFDPESAGQVRDPLMKSYTAGLTVRF